MQTIKGCSCEWNMTSKNLTTPPSIHIFPPVSQLLSPPTHPSWLLECKSSKHVLQHVRKFLPPEHWDGCDGWGERSWLGKIFYLILSTCWKKGFVIRSISCPNIWQLVSDVYPLWKLGYWLVCLSVCVCVCVCVSVYLPENEDLVPTYIQIVDAPPNVDVHGLGR